MTVYRRAITETDPLSLHTAQNLADLTSVPTARHNLQLDGEYRSEWYGVVMDVIHKTDAAITSGQAILTSATGVFTIADVNKPLVVQGAGAAGAQLPTSIFSYQSPTQVTLATNASTTVTGAVYDYGTDNTAALNTFLAACAPTTPSTYTADTGHTAHLASGICGFTGIVFVPANVGVQGQGGTLTTLRALGPLAQFRAANPAGRLQTSQMTQLNQGASLAGVQSGVTVTVATTGDWTHPTAPGFAASGTFRTFGGGVPVQTYTYTSLSPTAFFGVTGGTAGITVPDKIAVVQGDTSGSRGAAISGFTIDGNNTAGSSTQPLALWGRIVQRTIEDIYVINSWGDGEWWVVGQNCRAFNHNVENNRGTGRVFDAGTGGHQFYSSELTGNGRNSAYNLAFRESVVSPIGYTSPTDIHFYSGVIERSGVDQLTLATQTAAIYFGAYSRITFNEVNINGSRPTITTTAALSGGEATIPISTLANLPISVGSGGTVVIGNDLVTFTGSTSNSLTGCSGVANPHAVGVVANWVANSSTIIGRDDNVNGAGLGSGLRFHNCIFQGDVGNNGVQGTGYIGNSIFDFQIGASGRAAPGFTTTGRNQLVSGANIYLLDDTAVDINEQPGSLRTSATPTATPGSNLVNWFVNAGGGVKPVDQLVKVRGDRGPTTAGVPTDALLSQSTNPIYDGVVVTDTTDTRLYYRSGGAYQRVANYTDIPTGSVTVVYANADTSPLTSQTTNQLDPTLAFTLGATDVWHVEGWILFNAANTTMDCKIGWAGPTGYTGFWGMVGGNANISNGWGPSLTTNTPGILTQANSQSLGSAAGNYGYAISGVFMGDGVHAGTVTLAWAQNTSDAGALVRKAGSMLILTKAQ